MCYYYKLNNPRFSNSETSKPTPLSAYLINRSVSKLSEQKGKKTLKLSEWKEKINLAKYEQSIHRNGMFQAKDTSTVNNI
jgi:uncharacterized protein YqjF (DUF2071 family)